VEQTDVDTFTTHYRVKHADGTLQAEVTLASSYDNTLEARASFPALGAHYEARHPIIPFTDLLAAWIDNGVLVDGRLDPEGLRAYTAARGIALVDTWARQQRAYAAAGRAICERCTEDFRRCQVEASYRRSQPGVTYSQSCSTKFQACSQGGFVSDPREWPCGPAPQ
jgi:hypothetical protein